ncbi:MAG TPA: replication-relaxation family protein [Thermoanaerobaculaceae bacterium]|nr:replication-relaxation family protein [Thermoanaerobaculaceae bacterium]HPS78830.1 replication-relaxation family protein [Thermoanaerobaculaceae bacterium]
MTPDQEQTGSTGNPERPRPPATARPRRDPRDDVHLVDQDIAGLRFIGEHQCVLQGQLAEACYPGRSEAVVSRRVHRWLLTDVVGLDRFLAMGCNQLWLTERGARVLVGYGHAREESLFPRTRPIAAKDLGHHLTIVDLCVLARRGVPFVAASILPDWATRRRMVPAPPVVPDLLLIAPPHGGHPARVVALEVDLGTESLKKVFLGKLEKLAAWLLANSRGGIVGIVVLTRGEGRAEALRRATAGLPVPVVVKVLPGATGRARLAALEQLLLSRA